MHYSDEEIERAKTLFACEAGKAGHDRMAIAAMAGMSKPRKISHITHLRTWRDYLRRRDALYRRKDRIEILDRGRKLSHDLN